jgi:hypothetical protein
MTEKERLVHPLYQEACELTAIKGASRITAVGGEIEKRKSQI